MRADLMELAVASGLKVLTTMLEADRTAICGPRYAHEPERAASRAGTVPSEVVLGGRKVQIRRPRVHVRSVLAEWVGHYNRGRPHASLGPGIPDPLDDCLAPSLSGHQIRDGHRVVSKPVLGGVHHEYRLEPMAA
ncbi:MAG TPA: integrase core domain-containing protein [Vicinamibacterales bacterium]|nr:integrase core domain-containing protein [Vicinamibacterales bacterium]